MLILRVACSERGAIRVGDQLECFGLAYSCQGLWLGRQSFVARSLYVCNGTISCDSHPLCNYKRDRLLPMKERHSENTFGEAFTFTYMEFTRTVNEDLDATLLTPRAVTCQWLQMGLRSKAGPSIFGRCPIDRLPNKDRNRCVPTKGRVWGSHPGEARKSNEVPGVAIMDAKGQ